jgi:hypothetical protein
MSVAPAFGLSKHRNSGYNPREALKSTSGLQQKQKGSPTMTAEAVAAAIPAKTSDFVSQRTSFYTRIWPSTAIGMALLITVAWMGLLG